MSLLLYNHERRTVTSTTPENMNGELERAPLVLVLDDLALVPHHFGGLLFRTIPFGDTTCVVGHRHLNFLDSYLPGSESSAAQYWIVHQLDERTLLLLQYLPPNSQTSVHWHREETETFYCLQGHCLLMAGRHRPEDARDGAVKERLHRLQGRVSAHTVCVPPRVVHQLATFDAPALNLIIIEDTTARTLTDLDHQYTHWRKRRKTS